MFTPILMKEIPRTARTRRERRASAMPRQQSGKDLLTPEEGRRVRRHARKRGIVNREGTQNA